MMRTDNLISSWWYLWRHTSSKLGLITRKCAQARWESCKLDLESWKWLKYSLVARTRNYKLPLADIHWSSFWDPISYLLENRTEHSCTVTNGTIRSLDVHVISLICSRRVVNGRTGTIAWSSALLALPVKVVFICVYPATLVAFKSTFGRCDNQQYYFLQKPFIT